MPCPIQIRETIQKSIDRKLPDPQAVMSQDAAKGIVDYLNKLWSSAITRMQQYSGLGGFRVIVNSLDDAVNKEFKRQQDAEKAFERNLDFFKGDEALLEQENRDGLFLQRAAPVKPGVQELFNTNLELASVGTPEQYSAYIDSIFPESKMRDVVYHSSKNKFEKFSKEKKGSNLGKVSLDSKLGFFFGNLELSKKFGDVNYSVVISTKNPLIVEEDTRQKDKVIDIIKSVKNLLTSEGKQDFFESGSNIQNIILSSYNVKSYNELNSKLDEYQDILKNINTKEANFNSDFTENKIKNAIENNNDGVILNYDVKDSSVKSKQYIVFEPEQIHILGNENDVQGFRQFLSGQGTSLQKSESETLPSNASPKTLKIIRDFLEKVGVNVNIVKEIVVNGVKYDANGVAQVMQQLISVVEGKEAQALPEEAMHFAVSIIKQTNPKLYQKLMKEINGYDMLTQVFRTYGNDPLYQKDGKPDVIKLKEEAIAKVLVEKIINKSQGIAETKQNVATAQSWWRSIVDWIKDLLYIKSGFDQMTIDIISGKDIGTAYQIGEEQDATFLQKSKQDNVYDTVVETSNRIEKPKEGQEKYIIDGKEVGRVSEIVKTYYDNRQKNQELLDDEYDTAVKELKKEKGTKGHADLEYAFSLFVDENGYLRSAEERANKIDNDNYVSQIGSQSFYETLRDNLNLRLQSYPEGTRFLKEVAIYNGKNLAGTVDFMAITKEGKIDILDWKFMNLNQEKGYTDVPWYKIDSWNIQMEEYKKILIANYGVQAKDFKQTRMIPILAEYSRGKKSKEGKVIELPRLTGVKIGDVNVQDIDDQEDFLLPVPTKDESTDNRKLDELLKKLNNAYERFAKEKVTPDRKDAKREQLQSLFKAIRRLQVKRDVRPLIEQAKLLEQKAEELLQRYKNLYENPEDVTKFSEEELNNFSDEVESIQNAFNSYINIHNLLKDVVDDADLRNDLRDISDVASDFISELTEVNKNFVNDVLAKRENFNDVLSPEKIVKGIAKFFSSTSTLQVKTIQLLFKKANMAFGRATQATQVENAKLDKLRDDYLAWANSKGISQKEFFSMIKKKDSNELIDQFKKEFYTEAKKAARDGDVQWIKDNIDVNELSEALEKKKNEEIEKIKNRPNRRGTPEEILKSITREISDVERLYSINTDSSKGWFLYDTIKKFPMSKWETDAWKNLKRSDNAPAKAFYDYIVEKNKEYANLGYISKQKERIFLPYVEGSLVEAAIKGQSINAGQRFWRSISIDAGDVGYGQIDPETGKPINTIPRYFTTPFEAVLSEDLFRTMSMYNEAALRYKYVNEIEAQVRAIARVEKNKKTIMTNSLGKVARDPITGDPIYNPESTEGNYELLDSMIKAIIYGQRYIDNQNFDAALFKIGKWGETINEKLGIKVFPEELEGRQVTLNKIVDNLNSSFSIATLGFNLGSSISNGLGGTFQSIINSGKYFTKNDFISAETQVIVNKFSNEDKAKFFKAFEYFQPLTDNYNRDLTNRLSTNIAAEGKLANKISSNFATDEGFQDFLMWMMRSADRTVQGANFLAFINNSVVIDGKVVNAREYLRSLPEYKGRWSGSSQDRKSFDEKFDEEVKKLVEEKGVMKLATIENNEFVIPGVERMSNSVLEVRRKVQQISKDAMGNLSEDDVRLINMNILGKSFMVFKNWIPRLVDVRFGGLKYNAASDAYEWGRTRMMMSVLRDNLFTNFDGLFGLITGNDRGVELMRQSFEKRAEKYKLETGRDLEMTEEVYMDLFHSNVNAFGRDLMFVLALTALTFGMAAAAPDDDEDPLVKNQYNYARRLADKLSDEVSYFYNPTSVLNLVGSGPFPAMSILNNGFKGLGNSFVELYGLGTGNEELVEDTKVIKYLARTFPFANQMVGYLPLFYPDMAKDLGIRVQSNYGVR
jgi:hypothetical protein